jgi:carbamoyl-phosphate synthase large subunit
MAGHVHDAEQHGTPPDAGLKDRYRGRRMLFLPGGRWQVPVIRLARHMGFHVICADGTPRAPGFAAADEAVQLPLDDVEALVAIGRDRRVDAVMTEQTDFAVPIVARIAAALGLRGLPVDVADAATNKFLMRRRAAAAGIRQPRFRLCRTLDEAQAAANELGVPLFFKPVDGQSSRGVGRLAVSEAASVAGAFARATAASRSGQAIFETCVEGTECTVEGFVADGRPTTLAISDKEHYDDLPGVARTLTWPGRFSDEVLARIAAAHEAAARAIGIPFGITHAEFLVDAQGQPWLVEIAARGGGSRIPSHIVPAVCGFEPTPALVDCLMGRRPEVRLTRRGAAQLRFLRLPRGKQVVGYPNLAVLSALAGVIEIAFNLAPGERVPEVEDDRSRHGYVIVAADTPDEARVLAARIESELIIETRD